MNKYNFTTRITYYQKARFFRKVGTDEFAYCIEPFQFFEENVSYESTNNPNNLTQEQINRIGRIAYFGYGYKNHTDTKWYAITQMMIWQASDASGNYYFTDSLNGSAVNRYLEEMNEINNLVSLSYVLPSFSNQNYDMIENTSITIKDENNVLKDYTTTNENTTITGNILTISNLKEGNYTISLSKNEKIYQKPLIFYQSQNSQNLVKTGDIETPTISINITVTKTSLEITKIDKETQEIEPQGEASLDGAIYELWNNQNQLIQTLEIKNNQSIIENLEYGTYYLKEKSPGIGYTLDENIYEFEITKEHSKIQLITENEVIKKKIIIQKEYGEDNSYQKEANISFQIMNKNKDQIQTITTNEEGIAEITLPYGEYTLIQKNTTEGYEKIEPMIIKVEDTEEEIIELRDIKIPVPNTHTEEKSILEILLLILLTIL